MWSNYNFGWPILAGALTCLLSNVMYLLSYDAKSLLLLVLSRFVMGFGMFSCLIPNQDAAIPTT